MKIIDIKNKGSVQNAAEVLRKGGILIFPTDTVYGVGCLNNEKAIKKLYRMKNRPLNQPTALLISKDHIFKIKLVLKVRPDFFFRENDFNNSQKIFKF